MEEKERVIHATHWTGKSCGSSNFRGHESIKSGCTDVHSAACRCRDFGGWFTSRYDALTSRVFNFSRALRSFDVP